MINLSKRFNALKALSTVTDLSNCSVVTSSHRNWRNPHMKTLNIAPQRLKIAVALADSTTPYVISTFELYGAEFQKAKGDFASFASLVIKLEHNDKNTIENGLDILRGLTNDYPK